LGGHHLNGRDLEPTAAAPSADLLKQEYPGSQGAAGAAVQEA